MHKFIKIIKEFWMFVFVVSCFAYSASVLIRSRHSVNQWMEQIRETVSAKF